jgi:DNA-binding Xre family transcriptional regulator
MATTLIRLMDERGLDWIGLSDWSGIDPLVLEDQLVLHTHRLTVSTFLRICDALNIEPSEVF